MILPSTFQERGRLSIWSDILPWFLGSLLFCCCWVLVFLIYIMDCVWLAYFYSCALLLLIRDIFLTLQSGQKVPKMVPSPLVLFLSHLLLVCLCVLWLLLSGENHNGQSSQPENSVLEQNVFSLGFGVFFWEEGLGQRLFWSFRPFCFTVVWLEGQRASSDYRANSGRASTANFCNCQVSWKDCVRGKDARCWSAFCRTADASAFVVTAGLQRACSACFPAFVPHRSDASCSLSSIRLTCVTSRLLFFLFSPAVFLLSLT